MIAYVHVAVLCFHLLRGLETISNKVSAAQEKAGLRVIACTQCFD